MTFDNIGEDLLKGTAMLFISGVIGYIFSRNKSITETKGKIEKMEKDTSYKMELLESSMKARIDNVANKSDVQDQRIELLEKKSENYITRKEFTQYMEAQKEIINRIDKNVDKIFEKLVYKS